MLMKIENDGLSWSAQCKAGSTAAEDIIARTVGQDNPTYLGRAVEQMIKSGVYGGVEVGFFQRISEHLIQGR